MGFELHSFDAPGAHQESIVRKYMRAMFQSGDLDSSGFSFFAFAANLPTNCSNSQWAELVRKIERCVDADILDAPVEHRCFKPNEQDYSLFKGEQFRPKGMPAMGPDTAAQAESVRKIMCIGDITPDYYRCAACTKPNATSRCGKCKVVKYCSRDCQAKHWKSGHKKCCQKAVENCTLRSVLNGGNDWLHITANECEAIAKGLRSMQQSDPLARKFFHYFDAVSNLGGCFVG
eukprot:scaffold963_cov103-Skeletonema_dohrnii-CCMP3373.AAC.5